MMLLSCVDVWEYNSLPGPRGMAQTGAEEANAVRVDRECHHGRWEGIEGEVAWVSKWRGSGGEVPVSDKEYLYVQRQLGFWWAWTTSISERHFLAVCRQSLPKRD
jgi:hypothetical protein